MNFTGERFIPNKFNEIDEIYAEHLNRYKAVLPFVKNKKILDAACGVGYGSYILSKNGKQVYGIDIDEESIKYAKKNFNRKNLHFVKASIENLPFDNDFFDIVVSFETIEHVNEIMQNKFLNEIERVLKKEGILFISTPNKLVYSDKRGFKNKFHIKEFYEEEFYNFLKNKFKYVEFFYQNEEVSDIIINFKYKYFVNTTENNVFEKKYIIAVCSNSKIENINLNSFFIRTGIFDRTLMRVKELQDEIEDKSKWALNLDRENNELKARVKELQDEIEDKSKLIYNFESKLNNIYKSKWYKIYMFINKKFLNKK